MTIMNVQLCIAVTYSYDYFEAKLVPNILLIAQNRLWGASPPKPPNGALPLYSNEGFRQPPDPLPR